MRKALTGMQRMFGCWFASACMHMCAHTQTTRRTIGESSRVENGEPTNQIMIINQCNARAFCTLV
jgi:hypothetical protein